MLELVAVVEAFVVECVALVAGICVVLMNLVAIGDVLRQSRVLTRYP